MACQPASAPLGMYAASASVGEAAAPVLGVVPLTIKERGLPCTLAWPMLALTTWRPGSAGALPREGRDKDTPPTLCDRAASGGDGGYADAAKMPNKAGSLLTAHGRNARTLLCDGNGRAPSISRDGFGRRSHRSHERRIGVACRQSLILCALPRPPPHIYARTHPPSQNLGHKSRNEVLDVDGSVVATAALKLRERITDDLANVATTLRVVNAITQTHCEKFDGAGRSVHVRHTRQAVRSSAQTCRKGTPPHTHTLPTCVVDENVEHRQQLTVVGNERAAYAVAQVQHGLQDAQRAHDNDGVARVERILDGHLQVGGRGAGEYARAKKEKDLRGGK